jgi:NhaA family Na+:H+ antiporter
LSSSFQEFVSRFVSGGVLLLLGTIAALIWVNSPWSDTYNRIWDTYATISVGSFEHSHTLRHWVNDALMAIFFFVVGLEIKRELLAGELRSLRSASLPVAAAIGGMIVPACIYVLFNLGGGGLNGWGIPMATDIAFAVAILTMLGPIIPLSARVFLVALAIVDDLGAILVIALFYTSDLQWWPLLAAALTIGVLLLANLAGIQATPVYVVGALIVWLTIFASGIHASIAGVLVALTIPARSRIEVPALVEQGRNLLQHLDDAWDEARAIGRRRVSPILGESGPQHVVSQLATTSLQSLTPLQRMEHAINPWSVYLILPLFALANAGIVFESGWSSSLTDPIALGIVAGLVIGKPVGIVLATWLAVRTGLGSLPGGITWTQIIGLGFLAGIGFTMSLFISNLAFTDIGQIETAKTGIFAASIVAAAIGVFILRRSQPSSARPGTAGDRDSTDGIASSEEPQR